MLPGTEGGQAPFWSPDSLWVGFFTQSLVEENERNWRVCHHSVRGSWLSRGATWNQIT